MTQRAAVVLGVLCCSSSTRSAADFTNASRANVSVARQTVQFHVGHPNVIASSLTAVFVKWTE